MTRPHPLLLTAALLAVLCAAATAQAQEGDAPRTWAALFGTHSPACAGENLPEEQRRQFRALLLEHQRRLCDLGRRLYACQLEYDALEDSTTEHDQRQLGQLHRQMQDLRKVMVEEDDDFAKTTKKRFGLDISGGLHCAAAVNAASGE